MGAQAAARLGDEIAHGFGLAAMVAGAVVGALVGAAVVAATAATGGAAAVVFAGAVAAGGLSMFQIVKGLWTIFDLPEPTTGVLILGSMNVLTNRRSAMRAALDMSAGCSGLPLNHPFLPFPVTIAEGSKTVLINSMPAARVTSKLVCGAHIKSGSPDVLIGGETTATGFVFDLEGWAHTGLECLGYAALAGGAVLAGMAGAAAFLGFAAFTGATVLAFAGLGILGDRLGPGYRDLLQGVAGMAMLLASPKIAKAFGPEEPADPDVALWEATFRATRNRRVTEGAMDRDGNIATAASGDEVATLLDLPPGNLEPAGAPPGKCGMPRAVEELGNQHHEGALPEGPIRVTKGGFRYRPNDGQYYYKAPCRNCGEIMNRNPQLEPSGLPPGVPDGLAPGEEVPFNPPPNWTDP